MNAFAGPCVLILDGRRLEHCTCALEGDSGYGSKRYGFLSAPPEMLRAAKTAKLVEIELSAKPPQAVSILHITDIGLALISLPRSAKISVMLSSEHWSHIVIGENLREVCIKAESFLCNTDRADSPLGIKVAGGAPGSADHIRDYLAALQAQISFEQLSWGAGDQPLANLVLAHRRAKRFAEASNASRQRQTGIPNGEQLECIDCHIHCAQIRIEKQRRTIADMAVAGGDLRELAEKLLFTMSESLRLMERHREVISRQLISEI